MWPADVVQRQALGVLHDWRTAKTKPIQQLSRMLSQASQEYADRFLIELIQNGFDAHGPSSGDGRVEIILDDTDGEHGSVLVANTGRPFTESNFEALASLGLSDKAAGEGIGNKGLGFKSVLQVSDWPEVYSQDPALFGTSHFAGFCFGFADDAALAKLVPDSAERVRAMAEVSRYLLPIPIPIDAQNKTVRALAMGGFASVVRLRLKSKEAREVANERMRDLLDPKVPLLLFLDRLSEISFIWRTREGEERHALNRRCDLISPPAGAQSIRASNVDLGDAGKYLLLERALDRHRIENALRSSIEAGHVDERWSSWDGEATVAVALRTDRDLDEGRLFTFLPMGEQSRSPLHAHVHAPFFVKLARTELNFAVAYNAALLEGIARLCATAAPAIANSTHAYDVSAAADLVSWRQHLEVLLEAFNATGADLADVILVATMPRRSGTRTSLREVRAWQADETVVLTPNWLADHLDVALVGPQLGTERVGRLCELAVHVLDRDLSPSPDELGTWTEQRAQDLLAEPWDPKRWMDYYDDVSVVWDGNWPALRGRRILIDNEQRLQPAGKGDGPTVFFFPERGVQGEEEVEGALDMTLPRRLQRYLTFTHRELEWYDSGRASRARAFFGHLVRRYQTAEVLEEIGSLLARKPADSVFEDALRIVYRLHGRVGARPSLDALNLRVPTRSGWLDARRVRFSNEWPAPAASLLARLIEEAGGASPELADLGNRLLLGPSDWLPPEADLEGWTLFLERVGVHHGLWPEGSPAHITLRGGSYRPSEIARRLRLSPEQASSFVAASPDADGFLDYPYTEYVNVGAFWRFPGQGEVESLSDGARRLYAELVVRTLLRTGSSHFHAGVRRKNHPSDTPSQWPTPLGVFVRAASWIPVRRRNQEVFDTLDRAWLFDERGAAPAWAPVVPADLARLVEGKALNGLRDAGLRIWSDANYATDLLETLVDLVRGAEVASNPERLFVRTCEEAWQRIVRSQNTEAADWSPGSVVVRAGDRVRAIDLSVEGDPLYVDDGSGPPLMRALRDAGAAMLCARSLDGPLIAQRLKRSVRPIRLLDGVAVAVEADGVPFIPDASAPLVVSIVGNWLTLLVQGALEFKSGQFRRHSPDALRAASEAVRQLRFRHATSVGITVDGRPIGDNSTTGDAVLVADEAAPTVLVVGSDSDRWQLAEIVTRPLAELVEVADLKSVLFEAIVRLRRAVDATGVEHPSRAQIAASLDLDETDLEEAGALVRLSTLELATRLAVVIAARDGLEKARELFVAAQSAESESDLVMLAESVIADPDDLISQVRDAAEVNDLRHVLGLAFGSFDAALREFGLPSIADPDGQARYFSAFVDLHRTELVDALRKAFLMQFRGGASLETYVQLRELPSLTADPAWVQECERPTDQQMMARVAAWLDGHGAPLTEIAALASVDDVRAQNASLVRGVAHEAGSAIRAWCNGHHVLPHQYWVNATGAQAIADWASIVGFIDFEPIDQDRVLREFHEGGLWPVDMPLSLDLGALNLSEESLANERDRETRERLERERERRTVLVGDERFGSDPEDLCKLMAVLSASVGTSFADRSGHASLADAPAEPPRREPGGRRHRAAGRRAGVTEDQATVIGFAGEVVAREWLALEYPNAEVFWASGYRDLVLGGTEGSDDLGYDIKLIEKSGTRFFEVKATTGEEFWFDLTPGEVEFARSIRRKDDYAILYVRRALEPEHCSVLELPNPFSSRGRRCYLESGGLHLDFRLAG
jgi:hypothetical protein